MLGAEAEDTPTRWLNHFYDPVHNSGLLFDRQHLSAKAWAVNPKEQTNFSLGDKSWPRAIADYNVGDRENAFKELGHILHLIADMSVPAHTRADIHIMPGDSYETYVKQNWAVIQKQISSQFIAVSSLNQAFDNLANYSNNNFYSDDTINIQFFPSPSINSINILDKNIDKKNYRFYLNNYNIPLCFNYKINDWNNEFSVSKSCVLNDPIILSNHANILVSKAIGYSAGVIKLFFSEAEITAQTDLPAKRVSLWGWGDQVIGWGVSTAIDAKNYLVDTFGGNNEAISQAPAIMAPAIVVPPAVLPDQDPGSLTEDTSFRWNDNIMSAPVVVVSPLPIKKVLGEKIVAPVSPPIVVPKPDSESGMLNSPAPSQGNDSVGSGNGNTPAPVALFSVPAPTVSQNNGSSGSYASGGANGSTASEIPVKDPDIHQDDNVNEDDSVTDVDPDLRQDDSVNEDDSVTSTPAEDPDFHQDDSVVVLVDSEPPTVPTITLEDLGYDPIYNLLISISSSDVSSSPVAFDIEYLAGASSSSWQTLVTSSTDTAYHFQAEPNQQYSWRARARDATGNISEWTPENLYINKVGWSKQVVINEVAWAGTSASPSNYSYVNDKWLELYNNTDLPINIAGWKLYVGNNYLYPLKITTTTIAARGYYLLERSLSSSWDYRYSDETISDIPADYIFYFDNNNFKKTGERLRLVDASGKIIDEVDCGAGWFTDNQDNQYRTMERINPRWSGNDASNWQSSHGPRPVGRGRNGVVIYGSPRQANFGNVVLLGNQPEETRTLTTVDNPYIADFYTVPFGKTLIIEPGVVIKTRYQSSPLRIAGRLEIKGSSASPVVITSGRDQTFADPKLNMVFGAWTADGAQPRDWQGIWFDPNASGEITGLDLRYAGYKFKSPREDHWFGSSVEQSIRVDHAVVNISDSILSHNGNVALYLENATATLKNTKFSEGGAAINAQDSILALENIEMSNFSNIRGPLNTVRGFPALQNLQLDNNQFNGVYLENPTFQGEVTLGKELAWYLNYPVIPVGATLHLTPGVKILLPHQGVVEVNGGRLLAEGTSIEPVEITTFVAGDTWGILRFTNSDSVLENVALTRGNNTTNNDEGIITSANSRLRLKNVAMNQLRGAYNIIKSVDSDLDLDTVNLGYEVKPGIETCAIDIKNGTLKMRSVSFKNLDYGLYAFLSSLPDLDMEALDLLDPFKFDHVSVPMLPAYPWIKVPAL